MCFWLKEKFDADFYIDVGLKFLPIAFKAYTFTRMYFSVYNITSSRSAA